MSDAFIRFERQDVEGIVPTGTTVISAARRFGVKFDDCKLANGEHHCSLIVTTGIDNLSELTAAETEHFAVGGRRSNERLACEAKIIKPGEIVIMTESKKEEAKKPETSKDKITEEFNSLPLDKKFASLMQMEVATITEAVKYVADNSMKVLERVGDAITDFGSKVEAEAKKAPSTAETAKTAEPKAETEKTKNGAKRKSPASKGPKA